MPRRRRSPSSASPHGSGFMTMPAPPPYGVSSTVRWRSWVRSRRSCVRTSMRPDWRALPSSDRSSTRRTTGKIVTMSIRMGRPYSAGSSPRRMPRARASASTASVGSARRVGLGLVVGELLEEAGRRGHGERARRDVDLGHDRRHERHHDLAARRLHDEEVLRGQVVDVGDLADLHAVADDGEADELVVVPGVVLGRLLVDVLDPEDGLHETLGRGAVVDALEERRPDARCTSGARGARGACRATATTRAPAARTRRPARSGARGRRCRARA